MNLIKRCLSVRNMLVRRAPDLNCDEAGFTPMETMVVAIGSNSLSRFKGAAMTVVRDRLELLADLYRRDPANADLTVRNHGPVEMALTNPNDDTTVNRFNVAWTVTNVPDPRAGKV